ncbi:sigma-54 dependent transcriptional regulator [Sorangium cellulosum]|uniref:Sigma-54 dependent transcriptional regulator n=1 Tax=Sorangium cellulosum TaxID=56 RepID=A0A4P2Q2J6_SORCE|nr:sigma 54-interacting transcriptional regulator [Sorangium cellulosum]AUX23525.1 sigma-54 dependent transcriptional regulator [Sorangium cellulosum]
MATTASLSFKTAELVQRARAEKRRVLLLVYHHDGVEMSPMSPGVGVVVGREPPADVVVRDRSMSRRHARFTLVGGEVVVEDLGSRNGTRVAGQRVERGVVKAGDEVLLGGVVASVHVLSGGELPLLGVEGSDALRVALQAEIARSRFFGRKFALAVVRSLGVQAGHLRHWALRVREALRPVDRVAFYSVDTLEILLPEVTAELAEELARGIVARREGEPALVAGVAVFPDAATSIDKLIEVGHEASRSAGPEAPVRVASPEGALLYVAPRAGDARPRAQEGSQGAPPESAWEADGHVLATQSPLMRSVVEVALRAARSAIPVLLRGETGTGKEVLARFIHDRSPRRAGPLICVNCGAIPALLIESTLFGHERGAFTGASQQHKGVFEAAAGGTVLLDEVGELPAAAQAALLRVLETKRVTRVGATREIEVDVRVIAATHRDLDAMCDEGTFRLDLLYRLNAMTLDIPPLRARRDDIAPLAAGFLEQANRAHQGKVRSIAPEALALLKGYAWPGNVRELRNAIERAVVIAEGEAILARDLPERIRHTVSVSSPPRASPRAAELSRSSEPDGAPSAPAVTRRASEPARGAADPAPPATPAAGGLKIRLEQIEADLLIEALRASDWNQTEAARRLELPLRTLQHKIKVYGIKKLGYGVSR